MAILKVATILFHMFREQFQILIWLDILYSNYICFVLIEHIFTYFNEYSKFTVAENKVP